MVQFTLRETDTVSDWLARMRAASFKLDSAQEVLCVDPEAKAYLVRGAASPEAVTQLRGIGAEVFVDSPIDPVKPTKIPSASRARRRSR